jgi:two-component system, NarL family, invasion response regulator UvrY
MGKAADIQVLVADDHAIVRRGLKQIVADTSGIVVAGEACDGDELMRLIDERPWDVLILDISMPGRSGLELLKDVKLAQPALPVLMLSIHSEAEFATRALRAGAAGYLPKETAPDELIAAIRKVHSGGRYVSPAQAEKLLFYFQSDSTRPVHEDLSNREYEVLRSLGAGKTISQIAGELNLSSKTVSTYRARLLEKMNLRTTAELTRYAIKNNLAY